MGSHVYGRTSTATITCTLILILIIKNVVATSGSLSAYKVVHFRTPDETSHFGHFAIHKNNGDIYIGAKNSIYHLNSNFALEKSVQTNSQCGSVCNNYNKVLVIDYEAQKIIACGSEIEGRCQMRNMNDITVVLENGNTVAASAQLSTEAIIARGPYGQNMLYVGATYDPTRYGIGSVTPVARRSIRSYGDALLASDAEKFLSSAVISSMPFMINYMGVFDFNGYTHFATIQKYDYDPFPYISSARYISKLNRVCQRSKNFDSYTEIPLECRGQYENQYNLVQSVHIGRPGTLLAESLNVTENESFLFGVFARSLKPDGYDPSNSSAICLFKMADIEAAFSEAVYGCLRNGSEFELQYVMGSNCPAFPIVTRDIANEMECDAFCYSSANAKRPLVTQATYEYPEALMSSINIKTERNHTIAFVGTASGDLLKIQMDDKISARLYETLHLRSPVLRNLEFDETQENVFVLTKHELLKLRTSNCSYYLTSEECIGVNGEQDGDPHCGWCTEQIRCTRYEECIVSNGSGLWLPYSQQCTEVTEVQPSSSLPVTATEQEITLTVDLETERYESYQFFCSFDDRFESTATKLENQLICRSPPESKVPPIRSGDSVTIPLYVRSIPALVGCVKTDFSFYDCSLHTSCVSCVNSVWGCDWCVIDNRCTHKGCAATYYVVSNSNKQEITSSVGQSSCPQLEKQPSELLLPNSATRQIAITASNLPIEHEVYLWECVLTINGEEQRTKAMRDLSVITCLPQAYTYDADVQELNASLAVFWNERNQLDDIYGFTVTLYKCEVNRPDCSRCLSSEATRRELGCGWCSRYSVCIIEGDVVCDSSWISPTSGINCPDPYIEQVWPPSGPIEGKTVIEINGTNIGRRYSDINGVTVGGWACDLEGLEEFYRTGESVSCRVRETFSHSKVPIMVNVNGANGNLQSSNGDVQYNYQIPEIIDFTPKIGPQAGGTEIRIHGKYLHTGRLITAKIGDENCKVDRSYVNDTWAMCRTTNSLSGNSYPIVMTFDGVSKQSKASFTYQLNPSVADVSPKTSIESGGRKLMVNGDRLDTIQRPLIFVILTTGELSTAACSVHNASFMECPTPTINRNSTDRQKRDLEDIAAGIIESIDELITIIEGTTKSAFIQVGNKVTGHLKDGDVRLPVGFIMDGVQDLLRWSDFSEVTMRYHPDPEYETFDNGKLMLSGRVLQLKGKKLNLASKKEDVEVLIGSEVCEITVLVEDLLTCTAPETRPLGYDENGVPQSDILPRVKVLHGNYVKDIGMLNYAKTSVPTWVKVFLGIFFPGAIIIIVVVLIFVTWWYRKTRSQYEKVHNREEELLEQIISLKNALSLKDHGGGHQGRPLSHVTLSNNVRIDQKDVSIDYDQLIFKQELGKGAFGKVFKAILEVPEQKFTRTVAVKTVKDDSDPGTTVKFLEEGLLMKKFIHPNIMPLIGLTFDPKDTPAIVLPLMANGDLRSYLRKETTVVNGRQLVTFALDVAYGMVYLADRKFVHRDLAARNCMVSDNLVVKVADFGLSRDVHDTDIYRMKETRKLPVKWMAIENLDRKIFNTQSDVWSYGVLFWEIFTRGDSPYAAIENRDLYYRLMDGHRLPCPDYCPKQIYDVMFDCWKEDPDERPSFPDIVSRLTCILDSNDPGDINPETTVEGGFADDSPEEEEPLLHHNPTYLEPMDMLPAMPPPAPPTYVNDEQEDNSSETQC